MNPHFSMPMAAAQPTAGAMGPPPLPNQSAHSGHAGISHSHSNSQSYQNTPQQQSSFHPGHSHSNSLSSSLNNNNYLPPVLPTSSGNKHNVTRILELSNFEPSLKTKDIHQLFSEWEDDRGGFKIKWNDDVSCWIVFQDPSTAKRAYLTLLSSRPEALQATETHKPKLTAYTGPEVASILAAVQTRPRSRSINAGTGHSRRGSAMGSGGGAQLLSASQTSSSGNSGGAPLSGGVSLGGGAVAEGAPASHHRGGSFGRNSASFGQKQLRELMENNNLNSSNSSSSLPPPVPNLPSAYSSSGSALSDTTSPPVEGRSNSPEAWRRDANSSPRGHRRVESRSASASETIHE